VTATAAGRRRTPAMHGVHGEEKEGRRAREEGESHHGRVGTDGEVGDGRAATVFRRRNGGGVRRKRGRQRRSTAFGLDSLGQRVEAQAAELLVVSDLSGRRSRDGDAAAEHGGHGG